MAGRFVSEDALNEARERRAEEWKEAYARLGQEPPKQSEETEAYDPRPLYERLKEQKDRKQDDFEEKIKFKNQFRGIDDEESAFLDEVAEKKKEEQAKREAEIAAELDSFRQKKSAAQTVTTSAAQPEVSPPLASTSVSVSPSNSASKLPTQPVLPPKAKSNAKSQKSLLAGAIKRKSADVRTKTNASKEEPESKKAKT